MIIDLSHPSAELPPSSDVLLIGAGTCGLVLADALRRSGLTVTVLESGGRTPDQATERLNEVEQAGAFHYRGATEGRRRSIGGTSLLWGGALLPFQPHDIAPRPGLAPDGWPLTHAELEAQIPELERIFGLPGGSYGADFLTAEQRAADCVVDDGDFQVRFAKWPAFARRNTHQLFYARVHRDPGLRVCIHATATGLAVANDRPRQIIGASLRRPDGQRHTVHARRVVVCAGAIESTRLLLAATAAGMHQALEPLCWLGQGFHDHVSVHVAELRPPDPVRLNKLAGFRFQRGAMRSFRLELSAQAQRRESLPSAWAHIGFEGLHEGGFDALRRIMQRVQSGKLPRPQDAWKLAADAPYIARLAAWKLLRQQLMWPRKARYLLTVVGEQLPRPTNRIVLSDRCDAWGEPLPRIEWQIDRQDLDTLRRTAQLLSSC